MQSSKFGLGENFRRKIGETNKERIQEHTERNLEIIPKETRRYEFYCRQVYNINAMSCSLKTCKNDYKERDTIRQ